MDDDALSVLVCGASAAQSLPGYLARLREEIDLPLRLLLTHSAQQFLQPAAVALYADETYLSGAAPGGGSPPALLNPTEFARRSRALVVLPATANILACAALGLAGTPAQTVLLSAQSPALFFPSMNAVMWGRGTTRRHVATLRAEGHGVIDPADREVYEVWSRRLVVGPSLPRAEAVAKIVKGWLDHG
jgi:phosphopantothenoylcysteine synthetase/decarboxylase